MLKKNEWGDGWVAGWMEGFTCLRLRIENFALIVYIVEIHAHSST